MYASEILTEGLWSDLIWDKNKHSKPLANFTKKVIFFSSENLCGLSSKGRSGRLWIVGRNPDG